jgi:hypothetical protein
MSGPPQLFVIIQGILDIRRKILSRVIRTESAGKDRSQLVKGVAIALRELMQQPEPGEMARDLAAFIAIALEQVAGTIDASVEAWEKRGYWVKADRFRMDWRWTEQLGGNMRKAVLEDDWAQIAGTAVQIAQKMGDVKAPQRSRLGQPWVGAYQKLVASQASNHKGDSPAA